MDEKLRKEIRARIIHDKVLTEAEVLTIGDEWLLMYHEAALHAEGKIPQETSFVIADDNGEKTLSEPIMAYFGESYEQAYAREHGNQQE